MKLQFSVVIAYLILISGCNSDQTEQKTSGLPTPDVFATKDYASGFDFVEHNDYSKLQVYHPWRGNNDTLSYFLVNGDGRQEGLPQGADVIQIPARRVVCLSTTHLGFISALKKEEVIVGTAGGKWSNNPIVKENLNNGKIIEIGMNQSYDFEKILELQPDLVFAYGINAQSSTYLKKLKELGIPTVLVAEFMEQHPLGKAEWLKFFGILLGCDSLAEDYYEDIRLLYEDLRYQAVGSSDNPSVLTGLPWKGDWFVPGGASFQAQLIKDAGGHYLWEEDTSTSGMIVDIEAVIDRALDADVWINLNDYDSMKEISDIDKRYTEFEAFKEGNLFNNNLRKNEQLGNDYWESGVVRPDLVLRDLVKIFHPELVADQEFYYYRQLK